MMRATVNERIFHICLGLAILLYFAAGSVRTISQLTGAFESVRSAHLALAGLMFLIPAVLLDTVGRKVGLRRFRGWSRWWVLGLLMYAILMAVIGILNTNPWLFILWDGEVIAVFLSGLFLGARTWNWPTLDRAYARFLTAIAGPITVLGLLSAPELLRDVLRVQPVYRTASLLIPATFFLMNVERQPNRVLRAGVVTAFFLYLIEQVLFAKRLPFLRALFFLLMAQFVLPVRAQRFRLRRLAPAVLVGLLILVVGLTTTSGEQAVANYATRMRILGEIATASLRGDREVFPTDYASEFYRFQEAGIILTRMSWWQRLIGSGLGGSVADSRFEAWDWVEPSENVPVRAYAHMGVVWAFLKGGAVFWAFFYAGILIVLISYRKFRGDSLDLACWAFLLGNVLFHVLEGLWMLPGLELTSLLVGASIGRCIRAVHLGFAVVDRHGSVSSHRSAPSVPWPQGGVTRS